MTHPGFLDQPFIKVPNPHPDDSVDFRTGEVIYSNPKATEWSRLGYLAVANMWFYSCFYWPLVSIYKTKIPNKYMMETVDSVYLEHSMTLIDVFGVTTYSIPLFIAITGYVFMRYASLIFRPFVSKIQYNRSKDLVFVTYTGEMGEVKESVHEVANIEHVTPTVKGSNILDSSMEKGGFMSLKDLSNSTYFFGKVKINLIFS